MADLAREIQTRIRTTIVSGQDVAWVTALSPLTVSLHGADRPATNISGRVLAVGDRVLVSRSGQSVVITHLHEERPQSGVVVEVSPDGEAIIDAGGARIPGVPVVADNTAAVRDMQRAPAAPTGLVLTTWPYTDTDGANRGAVGVAWDAVTVGVDGEPIEVGHYRVAVQHGTGPWGVEQQTTLPQAQLAGLEPGTDLGVIVYAVSGSGVAGLGTTVVRVEVAMDDTAPPTPSLPTLTTVSGTVAVTWNGLTAAGGAQPPDFSHATIEWSGQRGEESVWGTHRLDGPGTVVIGPLDRGSEFEAELFTHDRSGNMSPTSGFVHIDVASVLDDPAVQGAFNDLEADITHTAGLRDHVVSDVPPTSGASGLRPGAVWSQVGEQGRVVAQWRNTGTITAAAWASMPVDGVMLAADTVDATKVRMDEGFANKLAAAMAVFQAAFIGKLEADSIRSGSWIGQLLAGVNVKISDDPDDPLAEHIMLANLAMRIMRGDGDGGLYEATSLGGAGLDQLSMRPSASGSPRVVISGDGNASFAGHASVGTLAVGGELLSERLARLPQGIMADFPVSGAAIRSWGNTNYGLVRLSWQMQAGRRYKLSMKLNLQGQHDDSYWLTIRTARGSTQPTVNTAIFAQDYGTIAPNAAVGSTNHDTHEHEFTIMDTYNGTFNALVVIRTWNANREMQLRSGADYVSRFTLEDMGFVDGAAVVVDPAGGNPFTGTAPAPAPQPTPRKQTLHRTSWRSFRNGSTYSGASELEHGTYNGIVRRGQLLFPAVPSGATNIRAKLRIRATHTWAGSGATFYIGIGTESSLQTSIPGHSAGAQHHFARNEEREIPLPGWTTSHRSVWLGIGAPGTNAAYGRLDPSSAYIVYEYDLA